MELKRQVEKCNFDNILSHMVLDRLDGVVAKTDVQNVLPPQSKPTAYAGEYNVLVVETATRQIHDIIQSA